MIQFKEKMLNRASRFSIFCFLDNNKYNIPPHRYEFLMAMGARYSLVSDDVRALDQFLEEHPGWKFGHLSYDLKNVLHGLKDVKENHTGFPLLHFFVPEELVICRTEGVEIISSNPEKVYRAILDEKPASENRGATVAIQPRLSREDYLEKIGLLKQHIRRGDCYEINFCQEFFAENVILDPFTVYASLNSISPNPFAAFYRFHHSWLICASPERFLTRQDQTISSQPIKGTIKRDLDDKIHDEKLKLELKHSRKDQAENVMVVDMVRNDLTRICSDATVKVDELFGIYSFPQVHQMISTVSGVCRDDVKFSEILRCTFPMGSMTGAPKQKVMELIDEYEVSSRGIFSGSVGYMDPSGHFDFNVVIRSIMYNQKNKYLSYQAGGGITHYSDAEKEWEESMLKGEAIRKVLEGMASDH